jgi:hypothetical protein
MPPKKQWNTNLPDTSTWLPRQDATETLRQAFFKRCQGVEQKLLLLSSSERRMNIDNYDSGPGIEDILREELSELCPKRYSIRAGTIDDRKGRTAGDFEIVITNDIWFTSIKAGATKTSRKIHFPIEAVYAIIEVKQTLNFKSLDQAMEKLVTCHRLYRPSSEGSRIVENEIIPTRSLPDVVKNPLFSAILATDLGRGISIDDIAKGFAAICQTLERDEFVRALCILGQGTIIWALQERDMNNHGKFAYFISDRRGAICPIIYRSSITGCAFYPFITYLQAHLLKSVLVPEDIAAFYGVDAIEASPIDFPPTDLYEMPIRRY